MDKRRVPSPDFPSPLPLNLASDETPETIIWQGTDYHRPLLREGQVALLSGTAGTGKSFYALSLAIAGSSKRATCGTAGGLTVRSDEGADGVLYLSYEESGEELKARLKQIAPANGFDTEEALKRVFFSPKPPELWQPDPDNDRVGMPGKHWRYFWENCKAFNRKWLILDNAESLMAAWDTNAPGAVRDFMNALVFEARHYKMGVLLVCHPTKHASTELQQTGQISSGVVAGSAAYWNAARSVSVLWDLSSRLTVLELVKCNHGPKGWGVLLERRPPADVWSGFEFKRALDATELQNLRKVVGALRNPAIKKGEKKASMEAIEQELIEGRKIEDMAEGFRPHVQPGEVGP